MVTKLEQLLTGVLAAGMIATAVPQSAYSKDSFDYGSGNRESHQHYVKSGFIKYDPSKFHDVNLDFNLPSSKNLEKLSLPDDDKPCPPYLRGTSGCGGNSNPQLNRPAPLPKVPPKPSNQGYPVQPSYNPNNNYQSNDNTGWYLIGGGLVALAVGALVTPWSVCDDDPYATNPDACSGYRAKSAIGLSLGLGGLGMIIWGIVENSN